MTAPSLKKLLNWINTANFLFVILSLEKRQLISTTMKKITFKIRMAASEWIAERAEDEGQFEVLRVRLNFNHIYTGVYFLDPEKDIDQVVLLGGEK